MLRRLAVWLTWQRVPVSGLRIDHPRRESLLLAGYAVFYVALAFCTGWLVGRHPVPILGAASFTDDLSYVLLFKILALLAVPTAALHALGYGLRDLLPGWRVRLGTLFSTGLAFVLGCCLNASHFGPIARVLSTPPSPRLALLLALGTVLPLFAAALPEELFYRALLQSRLEATLGRAVALVGAALLFAAWTCPRVIGWRTASRGAPETCCRWSSAPAFRSSSLV